MKYFITIIATLLLAFTTSLLLEIDFIGNNKVRYALVVLTIIIELIAGFLTFKKIAQEDNN